MELPLSPEDIQYPHITQLGSGMFRDETFHAAITVCVELSLQANEMRNSTSSGMDGVNSSVLMSMIQSQQGVMMQAIERTADNFGRRVGTGGKGCKPFFFLNIVMASVKSRVKGEDPLCNVESAAKRAIRIARAMLDGASYRDAQITVDTRPIQVSISNYDYLPVMSNLFIQTPIPSGFTPMTGTPSDIDPSSLMSTDFSDFTVSHLIQAVLS
jgi:hypothetical protein